MSFVDPTFSELSPFDYSPATRLVFGRDSVDRVGTLARDLGGRRILLVTDPGLAKAGHAQHVVARLKASECEVFVYDQVRENPTTLDVELCLKLAKSSAIDLIVGLGGGSSMDTAKGCNFLLTNGGRMQDYWGVGKATRPMLPLIAIPTTAGTGSECQSAALIADESTHQKMACLDPKAAAKIAILDPVLTVSQPQRVTACTGLDAIAHAVETAVTRKRNPISQLYSNEAFRLCGPAFDSVLARPADVTVRGRMLLGAAFAGIAIETSMLGAAHAAANPLTAHYGIPHGQAVGMLLPGVVAFNSQDAEARAAYKQLVVGAGLGGSAADLVEFLTDALREAQMPHSLAECRVPEDDLGRLAEEASRQWTAQFNPRPIDTEGFLELYRTLV